MDPEVSGPIFSHVPRASSSPTEEVELYPGQLGFTEGPLLPSSFPARAQQPVGPTVILLSLSVPSVPGLAWIPARSSPLRPRECLPLSCEINAIGFRASPPCIKNEHRDGGDIRGTLVSI